MAGEAARIGADRPLSGLCAPALPRCLPRADATSAVLPAGVSPDALRRLGIRPLPAPGAEHTVLNHDARESTPEDPRTVRGFRGSLRGGRQPTRSDRNS